MAFVRRQLPVLPAKCRRVDRTLADRSSSPRHLNRTLMIHPVRFKIVRRRGSNLQTVSQSINGLKAVAIAPPSRWRNIFRANWYGPTQWPPTSEPDHLLTLEDSIRLYQEWWVWNLEVDDTCGQKLAQLRDKNLACYCEAGAPCHGDVLLVLANPQTVRDRTARPAQS
jgi:hypothetical protein